MRILAGCEVNAPNGHSQHLWYRRRRLSSWRRRARQGPHVLGLLCAAALFACPGGESREPAVPDSRAASVGGPFASATLDLTKLFDVALVTGEASRSGDHPTAGIDQAFGRDVTAIH